MKTRVMTELHPIFEQALAPFMPVNDKMVYLEKRVKELEKELSQSFTDILEEERLKDI